MMTNRRMRVMYTSFGPDGGGPPVITDTADVGGGMINISTTWIIVNNAAYSVTSRCLPEIEQNPEQGCCSSCSL